MKTVSGVEKPLAEWTLKDIQEFCNRKTQEQCTNCSLHELCGDFPPSWNLEEKPEFTAQEIEDAKTIKHILGPGAIRRNGKNGELQFYGKRGSAHLVLNFQSIKSGDMYSLDEIIGENNA